MDDTTSPNKHHKNSQESVSKLQLSKKKVSPWRMENPAELLAANECDPFNASMGSNSQVLEANTGYNEMDIMRDAIDNLDLNPPEELLNDDLQWSAKAPTSESVMKFAAQYPPLQQDDY